MGKPRMSCHPKKEELDKAVPSPYLFVVAINELSILLQQELSNANIASITLGPGCPPIHSLLFADDLSICGQASEQEATIIKNTLQRFCNS